jgi:uncharacterized protein (UPF0261 family)
VAFLAAKKPSILVVGMLNTKGREIHFLAEQINKAGGTPIIMETSCGAEGVGANIPVSELISKAGYNKDDVFKMSRMEAQEIVARGGIIKVKELLKEGKLDGVIAYGGATTTYIACKIMRSLPIGIPKIMCSTLASGDCRPYIEFRDIAMFYPLGEIGLNRLTKKILSNAAGMVVGAATAPLFENGKTKPLIGCTVVGVAAPCCENVSRFFESKGYEVITFHGTGSGLVMEALIRQGEIAGVLDISTHEITDLICGGDMHAGSDRLTAASEIGIPQVVSTAGLDGIAFSCSKEEILNKGFRSKVTGIPLDKEKELPGRAIIQHTPSLTVVGILPDEARKIAEYIVEKLNRAKGPTVLIIPMRGWSRYDIKDISCSGFPSDKKGPGPLWDGGSDVNPNWSKRAVAFVEVVKKLADKTNPKLDILICDMHINEPEFANLVGSIFDEMLIGTWKKGAHRNDPRIEPMS